MGQAEPATDAGGQLVVDDVQLHQAVAQPRPGLRRSGRVEQRLEPPVERGHGRIEAACRSRRGGVDDADADLGHERAQQLRRQPTQLTGRAGEPAAGGQGRRPLDLDEAGDQRGLGGDVGRMALQQHPGGRAVPQDRRRAVQHPVGLERIDRRTGGGRGEPLDPGGPGPRPQDDVADEAERSERADEQAAQVVAADVLHGGSAGLHHLAVGQHDAGLEQRVANGPRAEAAHAAAPDGQDAPDRRAWPVRQGDALPVLGQSGVELGHRRGPAAPHRHLLRLDPLDARRCLHLPGARAGWTADVPLGPAADAGDRPLDPHLIGEGRQIHAPSGTCCRSAQRLPAGRTLCGLATPSGSKA